MHMRSKTASGAKLMSAREDAELTLKEVANLLSEEFGRRVHPQSINRIEAGTRQPSAKMFGALSRLYKKNKDDLLVEKAVA